MSCIYWCPLCSFSFSWLLRILIDLILISISSFLLDEWIRYLLDWYLFLTLMHFISVSIACTFFFCIWIFKVNIFLWTVFLYMHLNCIMNFILSTLYDRIIIRINLLFLIWTVLISEWRRYLWSSLIWTFKRVLITGGIISLKCFIHLF